jgi:hypothetical protein
MTSPGPAAPDDDLRQACSLPARFADAVTRRDLDGISSCFLPGATWEVPDPIGIHADGRDAILAIFTERWPAREFIVQVVSPAIVVGFDGTTASLRSTMIEYGRFDADRGLTLIGLYNDSVRKAGQEWRFQRRVLQPLFHDTRPPPGQVLARYTQHGLA